MFCSSLFVAAAAGAEVTLDQSFGNDFASVPLENGEYRITDALGQYSNGDRNLFHSFSEFSVERDNTATFSATKAPRNVIARVTGDSRSFVEGILRSTIDGANLFLLNRNGIEVREGARLDVRGSLHLSTADTLRFSEGPDYGQQVLGPDPSLLSAADPSAFGFTGPGANAISLAGTRRLVVPEGEVLSLIGGDAGDQPGQFGISIIGNPEKTAQVDVGSGTLQIAAAKSGTDIPVDLDELDVDALEPGELGEVFIEGDGRLDAGRQFSGQSSGRIVIRGERFVLDNAKLNAIHDSAALPGPEEAWGVDIATTREIEISNDAEIVTFAVKGGRAGDVRLHSETVSVSGGAELRTFAAAGVGGDIVIEADEASVDSGARFWSLSQGSSGGNLVIDAERVAIRDAGTELLSEPFAGIGGSIQIDAQSAVVEAGARLVTLGASNPTGSTERAGDITLDAAAVEIRGDGTELLSQPSFGIGGSIRIDAQSATIEAGAKLLSRSSSTESGGDIVLGAETLQLRGAGSELLSDATAGPGGSIEIDAATIEISDGASATSLSSALSERGGDIRLGATDDPAALVRVVDLGRVSTVHASETGVGGNVEVSAANVELARGGQIFAETTGGGDSGNLIIHNADWVQVRGWDDLENVTALGTLANEEASGRGGLLDVDARIFEVQDGAQVQTRTLGAGAAGDTRIAASERVTIRGGENGFAIVSASSSTADDAARAGDGGSLRIETPVLELQDGGQVTTSVQGPGNAGQLEVFAERIEISGSAGANESGLFSQSISQSLAPPPEDGETSARGRGGNIFVEVGSELRLSAGGRISAETSGPGDGGSIEIHAGNEISLSNGEISALARGTGAAGEILVDAGKELRLSDGSSITTQSARSGGGKLTIEATELVYVRDSGITTDVALGADNGGDVLVDPDFVVLDNGDVTARAFLGDGGAITIFADHLFLSADSTIDASSRRGGIDGEIVVEPPETEVIGQLTTLDTALIDASSLLTTPCAARTAPSGSFVVSSRTALGASPDAPLSWIGVAGLGALSPAGPECPSQATQ